MGWQGYSRSRERTCTCVMQLGTSPLLFQHTWSETWLRFPLRAPRNHSRKRCEWSQKVEIFSAFIKLLLLQASSLCIRCVSVCVLQRSSSTRRGRLKDNSIFPPTVFRLFHLASQQHKELFIFSWKSHFIEIRFFRPPPTPFTYLICFLFPRFHTLFLPRKLSLSLGKAWIFR